MAACGALLTAMSRGAGLLAIFQPRICFPADCKGRLGGRTRLIVAEGRTDAVGHGSALQSMEVNGRFGSRLCEYSRFQFARRKFFLIWSI
jgi:hypothetical protein